MSGINSHGQMSPRPYGPQIKLDQAPSLPQQQQHQPQQQQHPDILSPGGMAARPPVMSSNTAPILPTIHSSVPPPQHQQSPMSDYQAQHGKPPSAGMSHAYSRSSPAAGYDAPPSSYHAYTPTTPGGGPSSQYNSPSDMSKYGLAGSQRNVSNTPLGLADIRPRADSSMSDSPGGFGYDAANAQPGPSNYLAPWAIYAFDWCKWRPQGNGAGKLAVGSYLEDGHNFVSSQG